MLHPRSLILYDIITLWYNVMSLVSIQLCTLKLTSCTVLCDAHDIIRTSSCYWSEVLHLGLLHLCVCVWVCGCVGVWVCVWCVCVCMCMRVCGVCVCVCVCVCIRVCAVCVCVCTCVCVRVCDVCCV